MLIDNLNKTYFIHIPKNGGTSVKRYILDNSTTDTLIDLYNYIKIKERTIDKAHVCLIDYKYFPELVYCVNNNFTPVSIIRNPFDRFVSAYNMYVRNKKITGSIEEFISIINNNKSILKDSRFVHILPQHYFIPSNSKLIKIENIKESLSVLNKLFRIKNIKKELQQINKGPKTKKEISNIVKDFIVKTYEKDFILGNYERSI